MTADNNLDAKPVNLTKSQQESAYFAVGDTYDPLVYENTPMNWVMIIGAFIIFYIFQALHWVANFELSQADPEGSTLYNMIILAVSIFFITLFIFIGVSVNKSVLTHDFYVEKISEQKQRIAEQESKDKQKAERELKQRQATNA